jgi:hypothetical protein
MLTAFQKFALMSTKMCQYNENKICLNEYVGKVFFLQILDNNCKSKIYLPFQCKMAPFYALIYILAYSESYTEAQKLSHRYAYLSVIFY